ncbi:MAG: hypothetical protein NT028_06430 [candidate division Zixibacteria bacterium]|jgi:hypothetical protein|nr:hypothetical protein [candidate division Zixibacteria bacterium]
MIFDANDLRSSIQDKARKHPSFWRLFGSMVDSELQREDWYSQHLVNYVLLTPDLEAFEQLMGRLSADSETLESVACRGTQCGAGVAFRDLVQEFRVLDLLRQAGFVEVTFIEEDATRSPDISAFRDQSQYLVEVKNMIHPHPISETIIDASRMSLARMSLLRTVGVDIYASEEWEDITEGDIGRSELFEWVFEQINDMLTSKAGDWTATWCNSTTKGLRIRFNKSSNDFSTYQVGLKGRARCISLSETNGIVIKCVKKYMEKLYVGLNQIATYAKSQGLDTGGFRAMVVINWQNESEISGNLYCDEIRRFLQSINGTLNDLYAPAIRAVYLNAESKQLLQATEHPS